MGWFVLGLVVLACVGFVWRNRKRKMASIGDGPISRDASTNYGVVQNSANSNKFDQFGGGGLG